MQVCTDPHEHAPWKEIARQQRKQLGRQEDCMKDQYWTKPRENIKQEKELILCKCYAIYNNFRRIKQKFKNEFKNVRMKKRGIANLRK